MSRQSLSLSDPAALRCDAATLEGDTSVAAAITEAVDEGGERLSASAGRGLWAMFDQGVVSGTSFVTSVLIGHACSTEDLGVYYLAFSLVLFARGILERLVWAPYTVYCSRQPAGRQASYAGSTFAHQWLLSVASGVALGGFLAALHWTGRPTIPPPVAWAMLGALPLLLFREYVRQFVFAHLEFGRAAALDVIVAVLQLGGLIALARLQRLDVGWAYVLMGGSCAVAGLYWYAVWRPPLEIAARRVAADWRDNWAFGKWVLVSQLLTSLAPCGLPWLLTAVHGNAATGAFAACSTLVGFANVLVTGLANQLTPEAAVAFSRHGRAALWTVLCRAMTMFALIVGGLSMVFFLAGDRLVVCVYGARFAGSGFLLGLLGLGLLARCVEQVAGNGMWAIDRPAANLYGDATHVIVNLVLAVCLVGSLGPLGLAWAALVGTASGAIVRYGTLTRILASLPLTPPSRP